MAIYSTWGGMWQRAPYLWGLHPRQCTLPGCFYACRIHRPCLTFYRYDHVKYPSSQSTWRKEGLSHFFPLQVAFISSTFQFWIWSSLGHNMVHRLLSCRYYPTLVEYLLIFCYWTPSHSWSQSYDSQHWSTFAFLVGISTMILRHFYQEKITIMCLSITYTTLVERYLSLLYSSRFPFLTSISTCTWSCDKLRYVHFLGRVHRSCLPKMIIVFVPRVHCFVQDSKQCELDVF